MSCCPNTGANLGQPFDPDEEGPSADDVARFGEDTEYSEYADDDAFATGGPVWQQPGSQGMSVGKLLMPGVAVVVLVAFVLAFVL
jgi:hypothetical protein